MKRLLITSCIVLLTACVDKTRRQETVSGRWYTAEQVAEGVVLYQASCAVCHANDGSATIEWRTPDTDGNYPPPPLDGTAHTWHHPLDMLDHTIANGGAQYGGLMPGFATTLERSERLAIIAWFQSLWSDEIYARWAEIDARSQQ